MKTSSLHKTGCCLAATLLILCLLSGCAWLNVKLVQEPYEGNPIGDQRREVIKQGRWFWGIYKYTASPPVPYDYYNHLSYQGGCWNFIKCMFSSEMGRDEFYVNQPGKDGKPVGQRLGSAASPSVLFLFRLLTLGIFWDAGFTTDPEKWGLKNEATVNSWFGMSDYLITADTEENYYVREVRFDPTDTVRIASQLAQNYGRMALEMQMAPALLHGRLEMNQTTQTSELSAALKGKQLIIDNLRTMLIEAPGHEDELRAKMKANDQTAKARLGLVMQQYGKLSAKLTREAQAKAETKLLKTANEAVALGDPERKAFAAVTFP
jgi:hypothetical protein